jgi:hypothetical protein
VPDQPANGYDADGYDAEPATTGTDVPRQRRS